MNTTGEEWLLAPEMEEVVTVMDGPDLKCKQCLPRSRKDAGCSEKVIFT